MALRPCPVCEKLFDYGKSRAEWCNNCDDKLHKAKPVLQHIMNSPAPIPAGDNEFRRALERWKRKTRKGTTV